MLRIRLRAAGPGFWQCAVGNSVCGGALGTWTRGGLPAADPFSYVYPTDVPLRLARLARLQDERILEMSAAQSCASLETKTNGHDQMQLCCLPRRGGTNAAPWTRGRPRAPAHSTAGSNLNKAKSHLQLLQEQPALQRLHVRRAVIAAQLRVGHHHAVLLGVLVRQQLRQDKMDDLLLRQNVCPHSCVLATTT